MLEINNMTIGFHNNESRVHMDLTVTDTTGNSRKIYNDAIDTARYLRDFPQQRFIATKILQSELGIAAEQPRPKVDTKVIIARTLTDQIKKVIFNNPATIVYWKDGTKTVVKANGEDVFDKEMGLAMAIAKKALGNEGNYYETFKQWIPKLDR